MKLSKFIKFLDPCSVLRRDTKLTKSQAIELINEVMKELDIDKEELGGN